MLSSGSECERVKSVWFQAQEHITPVTHNLRPVGTGCQVAPDHFVIHNENKLIYLGFCFGTLNVKECIKKDKNRAIAIKKCRMSSNPTWPTTGFTSYQRWVRTAHVEMLHGWLWIYFATSMNPKPTGVFYTGYMSPPLYELAYFVPSSKKR